MTFMDDSFSTMMTVSGTFLSISILTLLTLRIGVSIRLIKERLSVWQYDRMYDGMFTSILFGICALIVGFIARLANSVCVYDVAFGLFLAQIITATFFTLIVFWPPKFILKICKKKESPVNWVTVAHSIIDIFDSFFSKHKESHCDNKKKR